MATLHDSLHSLDPIPWEDIPTSDLKPFLNDIFADAQKLVDSVPIPAAETSDESNANTPPKANSASEIIPSSARSSPPSEEVEALKSSWGKPVKVDHKENPLGISVYKMAGKDKKGAWFARRSVHEGLGFRKWKKALESEFPQTMKTQGAPGDGNIRGIGGERRVEFQDVEGLGRVEVYHLSAQFPGPTTPRDFVTLLVTSENALDEQTAGADDGDVPRHFMVVSRPCIHSDCPERSGFIRGQYQSVEFIREIPRKRTARRSKSDGAALTEKTDSKSTKKDKKKPSASDTDLPSTNEPSIEDDEAESNPVEWIMITRSDPGGSVPRFMIERGTPGGICGDAVKFLDWACAMDYDDFVEEVPANADESGGPTSEAANDESQQSSHRHHHHGAHKKQVHDYETNGYLSGVQTENQATGLYSYLASAAGVAGATIAAYTPEVIKEHIPGHHNVDDSGFSLQAPADGGPASYTRNRAATTSSISTVTTTDSFASAQSNGHPKMIYASNSLQHRDADTTSVGTGTSAAIRSLDSTQEKELQRLQDKKRKLDEKLQKEKEKEMAKKSEDIDRENAAIAKAQEKHAREVAKQEEKYRKEVAKIERKKEKEKQKAEQKKLKEAEKEEKADLLVQLQRAKDELSVVTKERDMLKERVEQLTRGEAIAAVEHEKVMQ